ncbi:hypothetical protein LY76DRAFT_28894 [Colletotrichum caudatum]|nr:hypothetical protein LY76DRAFT_28894 [Colletotrichum caudatum]
MLCKTEPPQRAEGHSASAAVHHTHGPPHTIAPDPAPVTRSTGPDYFNTGQQQEINYGPPSPANRAPPPYLTPGRSDSDPCHPPVPVVRIYKAERQNNARASQACENCRQKKSKCDEARPCKTCKETNVECNYRHVKPKPMDSILEALQEIRHSVETLRKRSTTSDETLEDEKVPKRAKTETHAPTQIRTPAQGSVLHWPPIREFTKGALAEHGVQNVDTYPLSFEEQRAYLPLQGPGSGSGCIPDYSEANVWSLVSSFKKDILNMYPIMIPVHLDTMVREFLVSRTPSVQNLIVLSVLALGKVCKHRETMRDNHDSIPGLEYMAAVSRSMGEHLGRYSVAHAQTFILNALYYEQLGRAVERHANKGDR